MATFNFKVRATDNLGAFADRDFSINVRNSEVVRFIFTNNQGHAFTSSDGLNWTPRLNLFPSSWYYGDVIWAGSFWLMTKTSTTYLRSIDGINWTEHTLPSGWQFNVPSGFYEAVSPRWAYGNDQAAIVVYNTTGSSTSLGATSDGLNWVFSPSLVTTTSAGARARFYKPFFANNKWFVNDFVTSGSQTIAQTISADFSDSWTTFSRPSTPSVTNMGLRYINGLFFLATNSTQYFVSQDGTNWNAYNNPTGIPTHYSLSCILYGNGRLISYPDRVSTAASPPNWDTLYVSSDTQNWQSITVPPIGVLNPGNTSSYISFLNTGASSYQGRISGTFYGGVYLFGSRAVSPSTSFGGLIRSTDGLNWSRVFVPQVGSSNGTNVNSLASMGQNT